MSRDLIGIFKHLIAGGTLLVVSTAAAAVSRTYVLDAEAASVVVDDGQTYFRDSGVDYLLHYEGRGEPASVYEPAYLAGNSRAHSIRFRVDGASGACSGKDRSEAILVDNVPMVAGDYVYLGFRMKLDVLQPPNPSGQEFTLVKLWQSSPRPAIFTLGLSPTNTADYHWEAIARSGTNTVTRTTAIAKSFGTLPSPFDQVGATLRPGVWHSFVLRFEMGPPTAGESVNGNVKIWQNGRLFAEKDTAIGYYGVSDNPNEYRIKIGPYKDCTADPAQEYRVDFDQIRVTNSWSEVYPW